MSDQSSNSEIVLALAEEFVERHRAGERPPLAEYVDKYPELADEIREVFPAVAMMENIAPADGSQDGQTEPETAERRGPALTQLGDYRILREIGHGGMGIVYEAEQISLGRHVALKVLPQQALLDLRQRYRFEREAKAAAKLHHTNIVPVFGVGECDGTLYYVMQFIQGLGLDQVLEELKRVQPRAGARGPLADPTRTMPAAQGAVSAHEIAKSLFTKGLGQTLDFDQDALGAPEAEVARAEGARAEQGGHDDHAGQAQERSQRAPLHEERSGRSTAGPRCDSSVTLPGQSANASDRPRSGKSTYWQSVGRIGIQVASALEYAHGQGVLHRDIKPSNLLLDTRGTVWVTDFGLAKTDDQRNLTHTGDIIGTLRYMPPEAFEGKSDARSDIYALGLTLFELVALRPAYAASDRHKLIKQVTGDEPPRLDRQSADVPRDLVTIVHKAIEREASRRYPSAKALADDLQRFVDDEPIQARPIPHRERFARWARRNKGLAASLCGVAALVLSLSIGATIAAVYFQQAEERQRRLVGEKSRLAEQMSTLAEEKSALADTMSTLAGEKQQALTRSLESETRLSTALGREQAALREADAQRAVTRQNLYDAQMANASRLWETHRSRRLFEELLQGWQPKAGETDLRGWEWYYFRSLPHRQARRFPSTGSDIVSLRWSPDGSLLAAKYSSLETPIRVWDARSGATVFDLNVAGFEFRDTIAFSPDGKRLAVAGSNGTVYGFDARSGHERQVLRGHDAPATAVAYSRDGAVLVSGDQSGAVKLWRVATGREFASWKAHDREITCLSCDESGASLITASGNKVIVWDTAAKTQRGSLAYPSRVTSASLAPDGRRLATSLAAYDGERVQIWDVAAGKKEPAMPGHMHWVESAQWSDDGTRLVTCSRDQSVIVWDAGNVAPLVVLRGFPDELYGVALSPDSTQVAAGGRDGTIFIQDARNPREYQTVGTEDVAVDNHLSPLAWSHDGEYLAASGGRDGTTVVLYSQGLQIATRLAGAHAFPLAALDFGPGGDRLASADRNGNVVIWEVSTARPLLRFRAHDHGLNAIDVSRDGKWLATAANGPVVKLWNFATGELVHVLDGHGDSGGMFSGAIEVAFDPRSERLAVATSVGLVKIWDVSKGAAIRDLRHSNSYVTCVGWSPDGRRLASGGMDRLIRIWDPDRDDALLVARGHTDWVHRLSWHVNGSRIATVGAGGGTDVKIWNTATGREILQLPQRDKRVRSVAWAPDGMGLATASSDGSVRLYSALAGCEIERSPRLLPIVEKRLAAAPDSVEDLRLRMEIHQHSGDLDGAAQARKRLIAAYETLLEADPRRVDRAGELAELLIDAPVDWVTLVPSRMESEGGATFSIQPDGSILVGGPNSNYDTYTIVALAPRQGITGLRLETLPDPSFVGSGSGRSRENGNFNLSELSMRVAAAGGADCELVSWARAFSDFEQSLPHHPRNSIGNVIDGDEGTFWEIWPKQNFRHAAVFFPAVAVARKPGDELTITLKFAQFNYHNLGRFRLSVTDRQQGAAQFEELRVKMGRGETNGFAALGTVYALRGEFNQAAEAFARGLDVGASTEVTANILEESSQFDDAFARLIARRPTNAQLLAFASRRHDERGETELAAAARARARAACEEALRLNDDSEDLAALLAELIDRQRKTAAKARRQDSNGHALAPEELNPLAAVQPAQGFAALGIAYKLEERFDKAAECFAKAWDLSADFDRRRQLVAVAEMNDDALETLVRLHGDEPLLLAASARGHLARGEKELAADARSQARGILEKQLGDYADDRVAAAMLADLLLEDGSTGWTVLRPDELKSDAAATLTLVADGSVVAKGVNPDHDVYTLACDWDGSPLVALKIEALPHASLMNQGPGRCGKCGNFNLTKVAVRAFSESSPAGVDVPLLQAIDDLGEPAAGGAAGAIDDRPETSWSIHPHVGRPHWAVFQTGPAPPAGVNRIEIRLESQSPAPQQHTLGHFRLSIGQSREVLATERWRWIASQTKRSVGVKLGAAYFVRGQWDRAVAYLAKAQRPATFTDRVLSVLPRRLRPDAPSASADVTELFMLALAHERNGQPDAARRVYDEGLTLLRQNTSDPMAVVFARQAMETIGGLSSDQVEASFAGALRDTELAALSATVVGDPSNAQAYIDRSHWYARRGRWQEAADDLTQVIHLRPNDQRRWFELGVLLAELADVPAYERHCLDMLSRWAEASERGVADTTAKVCLLLPGVANDDERVAHLVKTALATRESDALYPFFVLLKGLHAHRNGRPAEAIAAGVESRRRFSEKPDVYVAADHAIEAMAHHQANEPDQARGSLAEAQRICDEYLPKLGQDVLGDNWTDWLIADLLRREASERLGGAESSGPP